MLSVGVAIRLGRRPAEVARWPMQEVALVAAYCELEAAQFKAEPPRAGPKPASGATVRAEQVSYVVKPKRKGR